MKRLIDLIKGKFKNEISRVDILCHGVILETINARKELCREIMDFVWEQDKEIVYAMYDYVSNDDGYNFQCTLHQDNQPLQFLGQIKRFDYDLLNLGVNRDVIEIPIIIENFVDSIIINQICIDYIMFNICGKIQHIENNKYIIKVKPRSDINGDNYETI